MAKTPTLTPIAQQCQAGLQKALAHADSISAIARAVGTTRQNVQQWSRVPKKHVDAIAQLTGVPKHELRPDLFAAEEAAE